MCVLPMVTCSNPTIEIAGLAIKMAMLHADSAPAVSKNTHRPLRGWGAVLLLAYAPLSLAVAPSAFGELNSHSVVVLGRGVGP